MITRQCSRNIPYFAGILGILLYVPMGITQTVTESLLPTIEPFYDNFATVKSQVNLQIISITHQGQGKFLTSDQSLTVKIKATPGVNASILLLADKYIIRETTAREIAPGIYQATIEFDPDREIVEGIIMARLQYGNQVVYQAQNTPFTVARANHPQETCTIRRSQLIPGCNFASSLQELTTIPLNFTSHHDGEIVNDNNLVVMGETQPNAKVSIKVSTFLPVVGNIVKLEAQTLVNKTITADQKGNFSFTIPQGNRTISGLKYNIDAIAIVEDRTSRSVQLTLQNN